MNALRLGAFAALASVAATTSALAIPIIANPGVITGNGQSYAVFLFADARDTDTLTLTGFNGAIFNNKTSSVGATANLGNRTGTQTFSLTNNSSNPAVTFSTGIADSGTGGDGYYHATYSNNYSSFGVGTLSATVQTSLTSLAGSGSVLFVGFEDVRRGDYDYNDLIFAFITPTATQVPEPSTLMLLGMGLVGAGLLRRKA